jgi:hypothetical protein
MKQGWLRRRRCQGSVQTNVLEGPIGVLAEGGDRREADHDDQGQHDRIFNCRRTVFVFQETVGGFAQDTHTMSPFWIPAPLEQFRYTSSNLVVGADVERLARKPDIPSAAWRPAWQAHSFASPPRDGFAISRIEEMNQVQ